MINKQLVIQFSVFIFITLCFLSGYIFYLSKERIKEMYKDYEIIIYTLENKKIKLLVADTPEKREKGLMFYRSLESVNGMVFIFPEKHNSTFWNKNTFMDLDVYWMDGDNIVGKSYMPSIEKSGEVVYVSSPEAVDKVIEVPKK